MALLDDKQVADLNRHFAALQDEVTLVLFTQENQCEYCKITKNLLTELVSLTPKIKLEVKDFVADKAEADRYGVDKIPAIVVRGAEDHGIRFFGVPAGYEFTTLIEDILMVSKGVHGLTPEVMAELEKVDRPAHIQVIISPTCPYCPSMVRTAHRFALANKFIRADMVEVSEYPWLAQRYEVSGVPHTMVSETYGVVGVYKELDFAKEVLRGIGKLPIEAAHVHTHDHGHDREKTSAKPKAPAKKKPAAKKTAAQKPARKGGRK